MFHTLSELNEKEKNKGKLNNKKNILNMTKNISPNDNYYGKGNKAYDYYNKKPSESLNVQFEKTKYKITLIVFKNGFILNNGPFRDRMIPENNEFMEEVEKGNIPHELMEKGINDLGILLINRKSEIYNRPIAPITQITQITQINPITINPYNQFNNFNFDQLNQLSHLGKINPLNSIKKSANLNDLFNYNNNYSNSNYSNYNNYTYNNSYTYNNNYTYNNINTYNNYTYNNKNLYKYNNQNKNKNQLSQNSNQFGTYEFKDPLFLNIDSLENSGQDKVQYNQNVNQFGAYEFNDPLFLNIESLDSSQNIPPQTPIGNRSVRRDIFVQNAPYTENRNYKRNERYTSSVPKKDMKNKFETFHNFKRLEIIKDEEKKKENKKNKINKQKNEKEVEKKEEMEEKKFKAFGGVGQAIGYINTQGLNVQKDLKNSFDFFKPICTINIRLFNGEIIKGQFNYTQTLRDIYYFVAKISGSNNFTLLDGFPPRPLINYDMTIGQLRLENTTLTQRIN